MRDSQVSKAYNSPNYNYIFNKEDGTFLRWGKTLEDDPEYSPNGPELIDLELSTICHGACKFCYKSSTKTGQNMSFDTFKAIFDKFPDTLTQIAFGIGDIDANPDLWKIMEYTRMNGVIPNITVNGSRMTPKYYDLLGSLCGAVAVSLYDYTTCYNAVAELSTRMKQVNIHCLLAKETFHKCMRVMKDSAIDPRLDRLNAIVFLMLKPMGKRNKFTPVTKTQFDLLVDFALSNNISFGFDSCTAPFFLEAVKDHPRYEQFKTVVEPCESTLFSYYINVQGFGFPCSFSEDPRYFTGIDVLDTPDFIRDVWMNAETIKFRDNSINHKDKNGCRKCTVYNLGFQEEMKI